MTVIGIGALFEWMISVFGAGTSRKTLGILKTDDHGLDVAIESKRLFHDERVPFFFHVMSALASRGRSANMQLFFITLVMRFRGLSVSGLEMMSKMNIGLGKRTYGRFKKCFLEDLRARHV